jgi:hypothetical protein
VRLHAQEQAALAWRDGAAEIAQLVLAGGLQLLDGAGNARPRLLLLHLPDVLQVLLLGLTQLRLLLLELRLGLRLLLLLRGLLLRLLLSLLLLSLLLLRLLGLGARGREKSRSESNTCAEQ